MRIHIISKESYPYGYAATNRINCYAEAISNAGYDVNVVVMTKTEELDNNRGNTVSQGMCGNHTFEYLRNPVRKRNKLLRFLDRCFEDKRIESYLKKEVNSDDIVLLYLREMKVCERILSLLHKRNIKVVRDLCEYPYRLDTLKHQKLAASYFEKIFIQYDGVIAISTPLFELSEKYLTPYKSIISKIPILINPKRKGVDAKPKQLPYKYIFHSGSLYENKDGILGILQVIANLNNGRAAKDKIRFLSSGKLNKSIDFELYDSFIKEHGMEDVVDFLGFLSEEEMVAYQRGSLVLIINKHDNLQNRNCFPTKLAEYLLSSRPVIASDVGESKLYLNNGVDSLVFAHGDYKQLQDYVYKCEVDEEYAHQLGQNGCEAAFREFSCNKYSGELNIFFQKLSNKSSVLESNE